MIQQYSHIVFTNELRQMPPVAFSAPSKPYATLPDNILLSGNLPICRIPFQLLKQKQTVPAKA